MNLVGHLRCFVVVAEELHFGRAAERLGMAQPPLSQRIQRLEKELGVRLFDRSSRKVELTAPGALLLDEARDILARVDRVYSVAERARLGEARAVRAGLPSDLGGPIVAALIAAFRERRPDLRLDLRETGTAEQVRALAEGALDAGVLRHPCAARDLEFGPMLGQPLGVLLPDGAAPAGEVRLADLDAHDLVTFPREEAPGSYDELLAACRRHGYAPPAVHEARHPQFAVGLVLAGTAVALVPRPADGPTPGVVWRPLAGEPLSLRTSCAWRTPDPPDGVADFAAVATAVLRREAGMTPLDRAPARRVVPRPSSGFLA
ncbi:LysR family transcriptional regulator [Actinomadura terrae]|uniref:LysR family transcriptional regulator n=1 Tax=Actinomadura terrae TaxID=604353 RepID=UPI001FA7FCF6|nr:LysR family transcriptional regulator [Actinomadura terrae]